jgi:hypothetical protein
MSKNNYLKKNYGGLASDPENNNKGHMRSSTKYRI